MQKLETIVSLIVLFLIAACDNSDDLTISKLPGSFTGKILPVDSRAAVFLIQGSNEIKTTINDEGIFLFENIKRPVDRWFRKQ